MQKTLVFFTDGKTTKSTLISADPISPIIMSRRLYQVSPDTNHGTLLKQFIRACPELDFGAVPKHHESAITYTVDEKNGDMLVAELTMPGAVVKPIFRGNIKAFIHSYSDGRKQSLDEAAKVVATQYPEAVVSIKGLICEAARTFADEEVDVDAGEVIGRSMRTLLACTEGSKPGKTETQNATLPLTLLGLLVA